MPARSLKDYQNIVARLRGVPRYVDQTIALMREHGHLVFLSRQREVRGWIAEFLRAQEHLP